MRLAMLSILSATTALLLLTSPATSADDDDVLLGGTWPASCLGGGNGAAELGVGGGGKCWIFRQSWYVFPWNPLRHSWLQFAGRVFEFIGDSRDSSVWVHDRPFAADRCAHGVIRRLGGATAGAEAGLRCALGCAHGYKAMAGNYSLLCNNCHNFVNALAHALLAGSGCPSWCQL